MLLLTGAFCDNPFFAWIGMLYFCAIQTSFMNHRTLIATTCLLALFAILFSSCSMEKRHYRNGYYVQHSTGLVNRKCVQNNPADAENHIEVMHVNVNSERSDSIGVTSKGDRRKNNVTDSAAFARTVNEGSEQKNVVIENKINSENKDQTATIAKGNDEPEEKDNKRKPGKVLTILGAIFIGIGLTGILFTPIFGPLGDTLAVIALTLGIVFLLVGIKKKRASETAVQKKKLKIKSKILIGIGVAAFVVGFAMLLVVIGFISSAG